LFASYLAHFSIVLYREENKELRKQQEKLLEKGDSSKGFAKEIYNFFCSERKRLFATNAFFEYKKIFIVALQSGNTLYLVAP